MSETEAAWQALTHHAAEVTHLAHVLGLLTWDQQVYMPPGGALDRGAQVGVITSVIHERSTDARIAGWLRTLEAAPLDPLRAAGVRNMRRAYDRAVKIPEALATEIARAGIEGFTAWNLARQQKDFEVFAPALQKVLDLTLRHAEALDPKKHPYDVMLDQYDPGTTLAELRTTFSRLRTGIGELVAAVRDLPGGAPIDEVVPLEVQRALHDEITAAMGYDRQTGRIDGTVHPFTVRIGGGDVRITTRLYEDDLLAGLGGTIHEAGHALYELGIPADPVGSGIDRYASLGMHESQSRFWENFIGRSRPFLGWVAERLEALAPGTGIDGERLVRAANRIQPSPIRIFADEVTYNLHIAVRFELEVALLEGRLAVRDLPDAWNAAYRDVLGIAIDDVNQGVLQDVHWSNGTIGYFPSYTLGNLYAAALGRAMQADLPDLWDGVGRGELAPVLSWLREKIHRHGHTLDGALRIKEAVGDVDLVETLLDTLWTRYGAVYGVQRPA